MATIEGIKEAVASETTPGGAVKKLIEQIVQEVEGHIDHADPAEAKNFLHQLRDAADDFAASVKSDQHPRHQEVDQPPQPPPGDEDEDDDEDGDEEVEEAHHAAPHRKRKKK